MSPEHWGVGPGKGIIGNSSGHENEPGDSKFISRITVVLDCTFPSNRLGGEWINVYIWLRSFTVHLFSHIFIQLFISVWIHG